jgi:pimeloyl-ACP methyl ester carboxylesterase
VKRGAVAALLAVLSCAACGGGQGVKSRSVIGEPGRLYEVNGYELYIQCAGAGEPTVILEAGYGGDRRSWDQVEPELQGTTRVCSYDRAGLGFSSGELPKPRTIFDQLDDLDELLEDTGAEPPFVVVGHSYGGVLAWQFARRHEDDLEGVVLLDPSHPRQQVLMGRENLGLSSPENVGFDRALHDARELDTLGDTPLLVVSAGPDVEAGLPERVAQRLRRVRLALHDDYARRSTDSVHVIAWYSPHAVQTNLGQPELVVRGIREVVFAARAGRHLRRCRVLFRPPAARCRH